MDESSSGMDRMPSFHQHQRFDFHCRDERTMEPEYHGCSHDQYEAPVPRLSHDMSISYFGGDQLPVLSGNFHHHGFQHPPMLSLPFSSLDSSNGTFVCFHCGEATNNRCSICTPCNNYFQRDHVRVEVEVGGYWYRIVKYCLRTKKILFSVEDRPDISTPNSKNPHFFDVKYQDITGYRINGY